MRGDDPQQAAMFSYISPEERVPLDHPLRSIRVMVDAVLKELSPGLDSAVLAYRPALDCPGEVAARAVVASPLHGPQ